MARTCNNSAPRGGRVCQASLNYLSVSTSRLAAESSLGWLLVHCCDSSARVRGIMADSGKAGGVDQAAVKGVGWKLRMGLATILRIVPFAAAMVLMVILWAACGGGS